MRLPAPLLTTLLTIAALFSGCTAPDERPDETSGPAPDPEDPILGAGNASDPFLLKWNVTQGGDIALRFTVESDAAVECAMDARYRPGGAVGWDGLVLLEGAMEGWMLVGSTWHDVHAHAGPVDTRDVLEGYHDDSPMDLGWGWQAQGQVSALLVARQTAVSQPGEAPSFKASVRCDGDATLTYVGWGDEVLLQATTDGDGIAAVVRDPAVGLIDVGAYATVSTRSFGAPDVQGFVATLGSDVGVVDVEGPGVAEHLVLTPSLDVSPVARFAGGAGDYRIASVGGGPFSSAWMAVVGLNPVPSAADLPRGL